MEGEKETEQEENLTVMKLPVLLPIKPNSHSHSMSSPIHSSIAASVPFSWEEEPGKPKQQSSPSSSSSSPLTSYTSSSPETHKSLELPPRLHSVEKDGGSVAKLQSPITVFDGPNIMARSRRLDSPSFRMMVKGSADCYGSFRSDIHGDLEDVEEDSRQQDMNGGSLALVKKRGRLGFFGFRRRRALKGKTEFGRGSYVFPTSVDKESECTRKDEEEGEDKSFGFGDGDGISCSQSSRFCEVKIASISRTGSFSTLPAPPSSSSSKSHFWTNVYAGLKHVVPWKNKKTTG